MLAAFLAVALLQAGASAPDSPAHAKELLAAGNFDQAQAAYESILRTQPGSAEAQDGEVRASERLALAARSAKDMNSAIGELLRAQKFAPENERLLYDLGVLEDEIGLFHDADTTVAHLRLLTPGDSKAEYLLARVKLDLGQLDAAEPAMREYLKTQPDDATAHYGLGRILQMRDDTEGASAEFHKSLDLHPEQTESWYQLADMAQQGGHYADAIADAGKVLARNPQHGGALTVTGIAEFRQKQYGEAAGVLQQAVAAAPEYQPAHYYLGLALGRLGRKTESDKELALAAKMADEQNAKAAQRLRLKP